MKGLEFLKSGSKSSLKGPGVTLTQEVVSRSDTTMEKMLEKNSSSEVKLDTMGKFQSLFFRRFLLALKTVSFLEHEALLSATLKFY